MVDGAQDAAPRTLLTAVAGRRGAWPAVSGTAVAVAAVVAMALVLRLAWIAYSDWRPLPDDDAFRYDWFARRLAEGAGFVHLNGKPTAFWPPGYALLLAPLYRLFGPDALWGQLLNAVLGAGAVALTFAIARRAFGQRAGVVAAAIVAAFPSLVLFAGVTLSETAFTFFALLALWLLLLEGGAGRPRLPILMAAGVVTGFAALVRGQALLFPLVALPFWFAASRDLRASAARLAVVAAFTVAAVAPWTIRNAIRMNAFVPISTNAGVDLWIGHHDGASGRGQMADALIYSRPDLDSVAGEVAVNAEGFREAVRFALDQPLTELQLLPRKLFYLYYHDEEGLRWNDGHGGQPWIDPAEWNALRWTSNAYYYAVLGLFAGGVILARRRLLAPVPLLIVSFIGYWTAVHLVFFGDPRFHAPAMPLFAALAAVTVEKAFRR
ncbi:MAG TPA: glycosyltransferase family 39 protein [Dehalococcoidia bacterium]|nr:glycosyltransferase family 39 protein [Dehalococcoidia bacterium]